MFVRRICFLLLFLLPCWSLASETRHTVTKVINGKSFVLESGDIVRLAAIAVPNVQEADTPDRLGRPGEPLGEEAKQTLQALISGKTITIITQKDARDRHNRLLGQAYAGDVWLQGAMLRAGYAMVYSFADTPRELTQKMLAEEKAAREAKIGIWAHPYYRVITPQETQEHLNRFKLVEGKVESVREVRGNIYINFFKDWRGKFHVFIPKKNARAWSTHNLHDLAGKTLRIRGWINYYKAPMISLTHPEQIETP